MTAVREKASRPEDVTRLIVERVNAGDADGIAELYAPDAVLEYPLGKQTVGRAAIRAAYERLLAQRPQFPKEEQLPTIVCGDLALTSARPADKTGIRIQVLRRGSDGSWQRVIDRPESK